MKILYDHQIFSGQLYGGISRYFSSLLTSFHTNNIVNFKLSLIYSENFYLKKLNFLHILSFLQEKKFKGKDRLLNIFHKLNELNSVINLKKQNFDIFHPTEYDTYFLKHIKKKTFILTVYDMIHEIFKEKYFPRSDAFIKKKKILIQKASKIIAISNHTKQDIIKLYDINPEKINVVHLASSFDSFTGSKIKVPERYILFVGGRDGYKNFERFLAAVISILKKDTSLHLVCVGKPFNSFELFMLKKQGVSKQVLNYYVNDESLVYLYKNALVFVFPSLYEGFGIPILEAFNCKCPLALSNASCFPEIALDAALYFDPYNIESIQDSIEKIIYDSNIKNEMIKQGILRAKDFSWRKTALKTFKIYKNI
ncbi:glycosyltransferase family 4 protein [Candidatus Babeliales bacterium]|nr:glycosyltransferase family 4 protein [Candidatus Babeliales bacterium]